jgi:uncharacterized protein DUF6812
MNRIDENGKIFTERVRKTRVEVRIVTVQGDVHGYMHVVPDQRVRDLLNDGSEQFIAVTDVSMDIRGTLERVTCDFIALNKRHIVSVAPMDEDKVKRREFEEFYLPGNGR